MESVGIHFIWEQSKISANSLELNYTEGLVHHYRHPSQQEVQLGQLATTEDTMLQGEVQRVESALENRFGPGWRELLSHWGEVDGTPSWTCGRKDSHGQPSWEQGIMQ